MLEQMSVCSWERNMTHREINSMEESSSLSFLPTPFYISIFFILLPLHPLPMIKVPNKSLFLRSIHIKSHLFVIKMKTQLTQYRRKKMKASDPCKVIYIYKQKRGYYIGYLFQASCLFEFKEIPLNNEPFPLTACACSHVCVHAYM